MEKNNKSLRPHFVWRPPGFRLQTRTSEGAAGRKFLVPDANWIASLGAAKHSTRSFGVTFNTSSHLLWFAEKVIATFILFGDLTCPTVYLKSFSLLNGCLQSIAAQSKSKLVIFLTKRSMNTRVEVRSIVRKCPLGIPSPGMALIYLAIIAAALIKSSQTSLDRQFHENVYFLANFDLCAVQQRILHGIRH